MRFQKLALAAAAALVAAPALAQSQVTVYGRVDLSVAQDADAPKNREIQNGSGSRLGFRGVEDLGGGLKAVFQIEHRFDANDGNARNPYWGGKSVVGLQGGFGRVLLGREENPAYTFSQTVADPWGTDTVAGNGSIVNGRIGTTRYSNTINYRHSFGAFGFGAQIGETPTGGDDRPFSLGGSYTSGPLKVGLGYEDPTGADDHWLTINGAYDLGMVELSALIGNGRNANDQKHQAYLLAATAPVGGGELRVSYGELKNKTLGVKLDKQFGVGYHYALSKRTTVYADIVNKRPDNMAANREKTGWDLGIKHNF